MIQTTNQVYLIHAQSEPPKSPRIPVVNLHFFNQIMIALC